MQAQDEFEDYVENPNDDTITAVEYCTTGEYLATGDRTGRITVLRVDADQRQDHTKSGDRVVENWLPYFQFQSHEPEFDFLKSLEIEAKINQIKFCRPVCGNNYLLSTNDKTIKLWKIGHRKQYVKSALTKFSETGQLVLPRSHISKRRTIEDKQNCRGSVDDGSHSSVRTKDGDHIDATSKDVETQGSPDFVEGCNSSESVSEPVVGEVLHAVTKRIFSNAHTYHINSLAMNSDGETYISADDLRVNWWNLDHSDTSFNIIDIKPENMEELTEVITAVQFHPLHCHTLIYSSSRGAIKMCDTRSSALCRSYAKTFMESAATGGGGAGENTSKSFIADILNSISDVNFSQDGRFLVSRDYLSVKIWDVNMDSRPVKTIALHDYLRPMLYDLYTSDIIFDKFEVSCSGNGKSIATGSYSNQLKVFHQDSRTLKQIELPSLEEATSVNHNGSAGTSISPTSVYEISGVVDIAKSLDKAKISTTGKNSESATTTKAVIAATTMSAADIRLDEKVLRCTWHPVNNTIAVAGKAGLCLYKI